MARKFLVPIDLQRNSLLNAALHPSGTTPSTPVAGSVWFDSSAANPALKIYDGSVWVELADYANVINSVSGTSNEVQVSIVNGVATIGLPDDVTIGGDLTVTGDLTVNGDITTLNTENLNVEDNIITLNSNVTGTPTLNAGIEVERGTQTNASLIWNETSDKWQAGLAGSELDISLAGHGHSSSDISDFTEAAQDAVGNIVSGSNSLSVTYTDSTPSIVFDTTLATTSYLSKTSGLAVDKSSLETALVSDGFTRKVSASVGNGSATSIAVTHNLGTRDVTVNVYDNSTYETVECDVVRTDTNTVTVSFSSAPGSNAYRVVVVG